MCRCLIAWITAVLGVGFMVHSLQAAQPFALPDCVADFGSHVLLNVPTIDAMIAIAEPDGRQPNSTYASLFIILKHHLERSQGLLLITREQISVERPLLLTPVCAPYPEAPPHIRAFVAALSADQQKALVEYRDLAWPRAHESHTEPGTMAPIPAGSFTQGDGTKLPLAAFAIDVYEVTNSQYRQFIDDGGYTKRDLWSEAGWAWIQGRERRQPSYWDDKQFNNPSQPVVGVTWYEAAAYCRWLGQALPTEPQWEKACRGTDGRLFPWGNDPLLSSAPQTGSTAAFTPVDVGQATETQSPYGVHDLAGNVLEWTGTIHDDLQVVLCGGSGSSHTQQVGCGVRHRLLASISANFIGFRCQEPRP